MEKHGYDSMGEIWVRIIWSLRALYMGEHPSEGWGEGWPDCFSSLLAMGGIHWLVATLESFGL